MSSKAEILADHYQRTFEIAMVTWEKRNLTFLVLLFVVGAATLLTFNVPQAQPLLVDLVAKALDIDDAVRAQELRSSFPYGLMQSILLIVVMYLMLLLYHRTAKIQRFYKYMAELESEIRDDLQLDQCNVGFTREGVYYQKNKPVLGKLVGLSYIMMMGVLLVSFLGYRVYSDFAGGHVGFAVADLALSLATMTFFIGYVRSA